MKEIVSRKTDCKIVVKIKQCRNESIEYLTSGDIWKHSYQEEEVAKGVTSVPVCAGKSTIMVYYENLYYCYFLLFKGLVPASCSFLL